MCDRLQEFSGCKLITSLDLRGNDIGLGGSEALSVLLPRMTALKR